MKQDNCLPAHCPACKRYTGCAKICPYCTVDIPTSPHLSILKPLAWLITAIGLLLLWLHASAEPSPHSAWTLPDFPLRAYTGIRPHIHWMLWSIVIYTILTAQKPALPAGLLRWPRLRAANQTFILAATYCLLAGLPGLILLYTGAHLTVVTVLAGLFALLGTAILARLDDAIQPAMVGFLLLPLAAAC